MINSENKKPNWPSKPDYTSKVPSKNSKVIPPRTQIKAINGLPHSPNPRALGDISNK